MQTKFLYLFVLVLWALGARAQQREVIFVHEGKTCRALSLPNVDELRLNGHQLVAEVEQMAYAMAFDSLSFMPGEGVAERAGWWGHVDHGRAQCYYWPDTLNRPDVVLTTVQGTCVTAVAAMTLAPDSAAPSARQRVGTKWRFTRGTLTNRRRFRLDCFAPDDYGHFDAAVPAADQELDTPSDNRPWFDLRPLLAHQPARRAVQVLNYWHRPEACREMPDSVLFGTFDGERYELELVADSLWAIVDLQMELRGRELRVTGDSLQLVFSSEEQAQSQFRQMDTQPDDNTRFALEGSRIMIVERFDASYDEVRGWLVRFDLDLRKPYFIRDDE